MGCPKCTKKCSIDYIIKQVGEGSSDFQEEKVYECLNDSCSAKKVDPTPRSDIFLTSIIIFTNILSFQPNLVINFCCFFFSNFFSRFKIQVRVQDVNGAVSLTLFHRDVAQLISKSASELLDLNTVFLIFRNRF